MGWEEYEVNSWQTLQNKLSGASNLNQAFKHAYIYRGQADKCWSLKPTILRNFECPVDRQIALDLEASLNGEFTARAHLHLSPYLSQSLKDSLDRWALMQHYGAPTRLLDWTTSPYVAAYFACASHPHNDGAVWNVHIETLSSSFKNIEGDRLLPDGSLGPEIFRVGHHASVCAVRHSVRSDRMAAQQGVFTVCTDILADHADAINAQMIPTSDFPRYSKLIVRSTTKMEILKQLHAMNISSASLFPGLDCLGRSLQDIARLASVFGL
jgi:hypothetical protein